MKVALICPPFGIIRPPLGLLYLEAVTKDRGYECDVFHLNVEFAARLGIDTYKLISQYDPTDLMGDWVFSQFVFDRCDEAELEEFAAYIANRPRGGYSDWRVKDRLVEMLKAGVEAAESALDHWMKIPWDSYDVIGFTTMFQQNLPALALAKRIKEKYPHLFVILGGPNCEGVMGKELIRQFPFVNAVCSGEGENAFPALLDRLSGGDRPEGPGIITARTVQVTPAEAVDMNTVPMADYTSWIAKMNQLLRDELNGIWWPYEASRGCWWGQKSHCKFCGLNGSVLRYRSKSAERVREDLESLKRVKHMSPKVIIVDNIIDMSYFKDLMPQLEQEDHGLSFFCETKANLTREQVHQLRRSGFRTIQPGIESLSTHVLKLMSKGVTSLQNVQLLKWCKEYGITPMWNILYGFVGETEEDFQEQIRLISRIKHLPPPLAVNKLRLDRFSPYFENAEQEQIRVLGPHETYRFVYRGLDLHEARDLFYYFEFDHENLKKSETWFKPLQEAASDWIDSYGANDLFVDRRKKTPVVYTVNGQTAEGVVLSPVENWLLQTTDSNRPIESVLRSGHAEGFAEGEMLQAMEQMSERGWLVQDQGRILSVVLDLNNYRPKRVAQSTRQMIAGQRHMAQTN